MSILRYYYIEHLKFSTGHVSVPTLAILQHMERVVHKQTLLSTLTAIHRKLTVDLPPHASPFLRGNDAGYLMIKTPCFMLIHAQMTHCWLRMPWPYKTKLDGCYCSNQTPLCKLYIIDRQVIPCYGYRSSLPVQLQQSLNSKLEELAKLEHGMV